MRDELLAYLLNDLDDEQRRRIEERLEVDPIWQHELERLRSYVEEAHRQEPADADAPLDDDALPADLVSRTCSFVQHASAQGELSPAVLPPSLSESQDSASPRSKRWTLLDLCVVASILIFMGTLLIPAIRESREAARRVQCQQNLHTLGMALARYAEQNNGQLPSIGQHENAGMYAVKLMESGLITQQELSEAVLCPSGEIAEQVFRGEIQMLVPNRSELDAAKLANLHLLLKRMGGSFAYRIGYVDDQGNYRQVRFTGSSNEPLMADKPSYEVVGFQSDHHEKCGHNVLSQDLSVRYVRTCIQTGLDKHWFLNEDDQHAAGTHQADVVMGRSEASPSGSIKLIQNKQLSKPQYSR